MTANSSNKGTDGGNIPTLYLDPDGVGTLDLSNCQGYIISNLKEAVGSISDLYFKGDFESALPLIKLAYNIALKTDKSIQQTEEYRKTLTTYYGLAGDVYGELGYRSDALRLYENFQFLKMQLKSNLFKNQEPKDSVTLFQFRKFSEYTLANLLKSEITLSRPSAMNDIVDTLVLSWINSPSFGRTSKFKKHLDVYKKSFQDFRIASFCESNPSKEQIAVKNPLMWAHYADEHRGFCVEYQFDKSDFRRDDFNNLTASRIFRVKYSDPGKKPIDFENSDSSLFIDVGFFTKSIEWSYENEVRLIQYKPTNGNIREQYSLSPKTKVIAIYFGYRCSADIIQIIKNLLCGRNIKFYQMDIDYSNVHRLKYKEI